MDVDKFSFNSRLPDMLEAIAKAHFIAFDLELSGIQSKQFYSTKPRDIPHEGKHSLQQRYRELKSAAERYQVLQVGLTCVEEDHEKGIYTLRPYNFYLNPVIEERLDLERIFSYQSGAVDFLLSHRFRMEAPFLEGVPYLSREEEASARRISLARQNRDEIPDIKLKADDIDSLNFVRRVRHDIEVWQNRDEEEPSFLNIAAIGNQIMNQTTRGLNNYQKRLVHQLVRAEFPKLVSISQQTFMQITAYDAEREDTIRQSRTKRFEGQLSRQIGMRWLVEAMVGGDLSGIDARSFARTITGEPMFMNLEATTSHLNALQERLKARRTVLVGHNLFTDLLYFYQCFFGQLPERVEDFQKTIHGLFPIVIDTKYLATHNCGSISPKSSLEEIEQELRSLSVPVVETHFDHLKYSTLIAPHEAGYDSFLTARVLIRLSAQLEAAGTYVNEQAPPNSSDDEAYETAPEEDDESLDVRRKGGKVTTTKKTPSAEALTPSNADVVPQGVTVEGTDAEPAQTSSPRTKKSKRKTKKAMERSAFSHATKFDLLGEMPSDEDPMVQPSFLALRGDSRSAKPVVEKPPLPEPEPEPEPKRDGLMPLFHSDFWRVYGNKLRVFGTVEGVCDLTKF